MYITLTVKLILLLVKKDYKNLSALFLTLSANIKTNFVGIYHGLFAVLCMLRNLSNTFCPDLSKNRTNSKLTFSQFFSFFSH